ncbi:protein rhomboid-like [Lutzomyia longipalpis]|uniref:protein rhomboid-like n=1 Tax=Lutzomyia longipalpis TaxID=7200 RepID=UPI002483C302|nr:protein rhomboid-like [Lutzomyia longipalpis]
MSDLPPLKEFPRKGARGRRASAAAVMSHTPPTDAWGPELVRGLRIDGSAGRRFSIQKIPEEMPSPEHRSSLEDLHLLMPQKKKMDYTLYPAMPADDDEEEEKEEEGRKSKKNSISYGGDGQKAGKRMSIVAALMSSTFSNKETKNSQMDTPDTPIHSHSDAPCSHLINMPEKDEGDELPHPEPVTASDIWKHMRNYIPWILAVTSVIQICLFVLDRDEFFRLLVFSPHRILEIWRFLSYTLLHQNAIHLALNVAIQIFLGIPLEYEQGHWRVFVVYFGGAVAGALGTSVFEPSILLIGASAGIYSILMSHIPHTVINFKNIRYRFYRIICVIILCTSDIIYTLIHVTYGDLPKIGISAHILGALSGLVLGTALFQSATQRDSKFKRIQLAAGAIYLTWLLSSFTISLVGSHVSRM